MIDTTEPRSDGWYLKRLWDKLQENRKKIDPLIARYEGNAPLPDSLREAPEAAKAFFASSRTGFAEMIVKAVKYPLRVQGVLTEADTDGDDMGDAVAEKMMLTSGMAEEVDDVHRQTLVAGSAYAIVSQYKGQPSYTYEDPRQVVTLHDPVKQSEIVAAAKFFWDSEAGHAVAYLYRPGYVRRAIPERREWRPKGSVRFAAMSWEWEDPQALPVGFEETVGVLRYRNEEGVSEFARHIPLLDRIDHMTVQGMTIATMQAFRQRAIMVPEADMPDEDEDGNEIDYNDALAADPGALWKLPETATLWESGGVDLTPVWTGIEKFIQQLSAVTFTPLAMFSPDGQNQSAAGAGFAREGRTFKIEDRHGRMGRTHARALAMLFAISGDAERSKPEAIQIIWRPAERYSLAEKGDAMTKYNAGGVPWRTRMIEVGQFTPRQVAQMESERSSDAIRLQLDALPVAPVASDG